jgi:hypothetical protein
MLTVDGVEIPDEIFIYKSSPSLENAKRLLTAIGCPLPFVGFTTTHARRAQRRQPDSTAYRRGGSAEWMKNFAYVDLLHDIYDGSLFQDIIDRICNATTLSDYLKDRITRLMLSGKSNVTPGLANLVMPKTKNSVSHSLVTGHSTQFTIEENTELYAYIRNIATQYNKRIFHVILDGIFHAFQIEIDHVQAARSLALCAFLHILFADCPPMTMPSQSSRAKMALSTPGTNGVGVSSIVFLTGEFQTFDIPAYDRFMQAFIQDLRLHVVWAKHILIETVPTNALPKPLNPDIQFATEGIKYKDVVVPMKLSHEITRFSRYRLSPLQIADRLRQRFCVSYTKRDLRDIFASLGRLSTTEYQAFSQFVEIVAHINLFCDAYRAEIAVQRDAMFVTIDRLAQVYYSKIAQAHRHSLLFTYNPVTPQKITFGFV